MYRLWQFFARSAANATLEGGDIYPASTLEALLYNVAQGASCLVQSLIEGEDAPSV
jgi:hypothetical protein